MNHFIEIENLEPIVVSRDSYITDIKKQLYIQLIQIGYISDSSYTYCCNYQYIRFREKGGIKPDKLLRDGSSMKDCQINLFEGKTFCFELLDHIEDLGPDNHGDVLVLVQKWQRNSWALTEPKEVYLYGSWSIKDIAIGLSHMFHCSPHHLMSLIVYHHTDIHLCYLNEPIPRNASGGWFSPYEESALLKNMYKLGYADLLLLQDLSEPLYAVTQVDIESVKRLENYNTYGDSYNGSSFFENLYDNNNINNNNIYATSNTSSHVATQTISTNTTTSNNNTSSSTMASAPLQHSVGGGGIKIKIHRSTSKTEDVGNTNINHPLMNSIPSSPSLSPPPLLD